MKNKYIGLKAVLIDNKGNKIHRQSVFCKLDPLYDAIDALKFEDYRIIKVEIIKLGETNGS